MTTDVADVFFDNPILMKHVRSRLRPAEALPWAAVVLVLSACVAWASVQVDWIGSSAAVMMLLGMQMVILAVGGAKQINTSFGGVRETGLLDFHRVSPLPPSAVALGFFLGAPVREYALAAVTLPFALFCSVALDTFDTWKGIAWLLQTEVAVVMTSWLVHAVTMLACLTRKTGRGSILGTVGLLIVLLFLGYMGSFGLYFGARWLLEENPGLNFLGRKIPWLPWLLIYELPALGFLGLAVERLGRL